MGVASALAAEAAGVSRSTLARWMARGRDAVEAREDGEPPRAADDLYVALYWRVEQGRARMAQTALATILQAATGGHVQEERVRRYTDPTGRDVEERHLRYRMPQWRASAWWLARIYPQHYGPNAKTWDEQIEADLHPERAGAPADPRISEAAARIGANLARQDELMPPASAT